MVIDASLHNVCSADLRYNAHCLAMVVELPSLIRRAGLHVLVMRSNLPDNSC